MDMFKIANQIIDAHDDVTHLHLKKVARKNPTLDMMSPEERSNLMDHEFALSVVTKTASKLNKFPINNHDSTWLSNEYFDRTFQRLPKLAAETAAYHIKKACAVHKVKASSMVEKMAKEVPSNVYYEVDSKSAPKLAQVVNLNLSELAEVQKIGDNYTFAQYAFKSPSHIKMASEYFDKFNDKMPVEYRHKYAAAIQRRAHELGLPAQKGQVVKYASDHYSGMVDAHLNSRKSLVETSDPKFSGALNKLASVKKDMTPTEFAGLLHGFDKRAGLEKYYGGYLTDPYLATFAGEPDPYQGWSCKVANSEMTPDKLKMVASKHYDKIKDYFGKDVASELKKNGVPIFDSLPNDAKEVIVNIADGSV